MANTRTVLQTEMTECGAACLSVILQYYGQYATLEELRLETDVSRDGCSAGNLVRAARRRGLSCEGYEVDAEGLAEIQPPLIIWWEDNHFVVFEGVRDDRFLLNDPACGKRTVSRDTMEREYSGIALSFSPGDEFRNHPSYGRRQETLFRSGKYGETLKALPADAVWTIASGLVAVGTWIAAPLLILRTGAHSLPANLSALAAVLLALVSGGFFIYRRYLWGERNELKQSWPYLWRLLHASIAFLEDRYPEDLVGYAIGSDRVNRQIPGILSSLIVSGTAVLLSAAAMGVTSPRSAAAVLLAVFVSCLLYGREFRISHRERAMAGILDRNLARQVFSGMGKRETIRNVGCAEEYAQRMINAHRTAEEAHRRERERMSRCGLLRTMICAAGILLSLKLIPGGLQEMMDVLSWTVLAGAFIAGAETLARTVVGMRLANDEFDAVRRVGGIEEQAVAGGRTVNSPEGYQKLQGNIDARGVAFGYGSFGEMLFRDCDFNIPGGSVFAITGGTGSGKSTMGKLISGLLHPSEGTILYDGRELSAISDREICASIAVVKQKTTLFPGSILDNITMWNPWITREEIERAVADACAEDCIRRRSGGYETVLGSDGGGLSGGEQQRIEIARALAANPSILILDEAFSAIDDETKLKIMGNVRRRGCTCILITQDPVLLREEARVFDLDARRQ